MKDIYKELINYIEENKYKFGWGYEYSIGELKELIKEIEKEYERLEVK